MIDTARGLVIAMAVAAGPATAATPRVTLDIPAGPLDDALQAYSRQTHRQLFYKSSLVAGMSVGPLTGDFTADDGLRRLLAGHAIRFTTPNDRLVVLAPAPSGPAARPERRRSQRPRPAGTPVVPGTAALPEPDDIVVTGSHIRGADTGASPATVLTRDDLDRSGRTTVAQALALLPQNFAGAASEQSALTLADGSGTNASLATGINIRGLGAGATLVLVNGRRLAGSGTIGDFGDISNVPTAAVDRVEVLLDGASAIYGSDAVGGVVNIILKRRFDGAETRVAAGQATRGGAREIQAAQTVGTDWAGGSALLSYEYYHRDAVASASRRYAANADLRPLGGTDHRQFYSAPGNILAFDPASGGFGPAFAITPGPEGAVRFDAGSVNLENQRLNTDLLPQQERHSVFARITEDVGDRVHLSGDVRYSRRTFEVRGTGSPAVIVNTVANPFFVSPSGAPFDPIAYSFARELGPSLTSGRAETVGASGGADIDLPRGWQARAYFAFAQQRERNRVGNIVNTQSLAEALGTSPDDPATGFSAKRDGYFNPYGAGGANPAAVLDFIGTGLQLFDSRSRVTTYNADADGTLVELAGGAAKLALGVNVRREAFATSGTTFLFTSTPTITPVRTTARTVDAAFAELRVPLVGTGNAGPGIAALELTAAARVEHYSDFGTTTNPKLGIVGSPTRGITLRATYGTSFRAPNLRQIDDSSRISATILPQASGAQTAVVLLAGGNPDLGPETARSWTAGFDVAPARLPGVRASATWFRTRFGNRIARPALDDLNNALINPALAPFVSLVSPSTSAADLARVAALLADPSSTAGGSFQPQTIGAIVDARYVNTASTEVEGIDWTLAYGFTRGPDHVDLSATASNLLHYREQLTPAAPTLDTVNLPGKPLAFRGRAGIAWTRGPFGASTTVTYANRYHDLAGRRIGAWTTVDVQFRVAPEAGPLRGTTLALNVQNLGDASPPFYDSPSGVGYDASNADALGRVVSLQLTRRW